MPFLLTGILLGLGAAIPLGPVNMEIIRRNLRHGFLYGMVTGAGACLADLIYLLLLSFGLLTLLQYPIIMKCIGIAGSLILGWFGIQALRSFPQKSTHRDTTKPSLWKYGIGGLTMTLLNPFTILFWASVSSRLSSLSTETASITLAGSGVILGTFGWVLFLNGLLHVTRHYMNHTIVKLLNYIGGLILLGFSVTGLINACYLR